MSIEAMFTFFLAIFIFSITPGPGVFALISNSLTNGIKTSIFLSLGMILSDIVYLILAFYGLSTIANNYASLFEAIQILGGLYLIYLAYKIWTAPLETKMKNTKKNNFSYLSNFMKGFFISVSNPKVIIFYVAFLPTFVDLTVISTNEMIIVLILAFLSLMSGLTMISYSAYKAKQLLSESKSVQRLNRTSGSIMGLAGLYLIYKG